MFRKQHKQQSFLQGAAILTVGTILVKLIGALFKIPLTNLIGEVGIGYFNTAYQIYLPVYTIATAGFPIAVSRLVAQSVACGRWQDVRQLRKSAVPLFFLSGLAGMALMFFGAAPYTRLVQSPGAALAIRVLSPTVLFCCVLSALRGYYTGLRNMTPNAISQVVEAVCKLGLGLWCAAAVLKTGMNQYESQTTVFGIPAESAEQARQLLLPYAAAAAIVGVTVGAAAALLYLLLYEKICGDGVSAGALAASPPAAKKSSQLREIAEISLPVCLGALVINLGSLADAALLQSRMNTVPVSVLQRLWAGKLPETLLPEELVPYLYGCYTMAQAVSALVPTLTQSVGVSALPTIAAAWAGKNCEKIRAAMENVLRIAGILAFPAGAGLFFLAEPVLLLLYGSRPLGAACAAPSLRLLGVTAVFMTISVPVNSMLQAVGRADLPVKLLLAGMTVKIASNYFLCALPQLGLLGACAGSLLCYALIACGGLAALCRVTEAELRPLRTLLRPALAGLACGLTAKLAYALLPLQSGSVRTLLSVLAAGGVYLILLLSFRILTKSDLYGFLGKTPKKLKNTEKCGKIGKTQRKWEKANEIPKKRAL